MPRTTFTSRELKEYRQQLQDLVHRLGGKMDSLRNEALHPLGREASGQDAQPSDQGSLGAEEFRALAVLEPEEHILAEATAALLRLEEGTFGRCEECNKSIARARLEALPYARRCVRCEEVNEAREV